MARVLGTVGVVLGVAAIIAGIIFQILGAASVVYCSVIGGGIVLLVAGGAIWAVHALRDTRHGKPTSVGV